MFDKSLNTPDLMAVVSNYLTQFKPIKCLPNCLMVVDDWLRLIWGLYVKELKCIVLFEQVYTVLYHGTPETRSQLREKLMRIRKYSHGLKSLPVVISSYEILMRDRPLLERYGLEWKYLIVDEGHRLKNLNCKLIRLKICFALFWTFWKVFLIGVCGFLFPLIQIEYVDF